VTEDPDPLLAVASLEPLPQVIVLAASAGGLAAISEVLSGLSMDFPAPIVIVQHLEPYHPSRMVEILRYRFLMPIKQAEEGDVLQSGKIYIAPPNYHVLVNPDSTLSLSSAPKVNFSRPAADLLFESAAISLQGRAIAVVLTGRGQDGAMGIQAIKQGGGLVLVQNQSTATYFGMPGAAIATGVVDYILPIDKIAAKLVALCTKQAHEQP
jgi:two-component system, chemotaxis family, protein-glutamate methylesterase/glutaminase